MTALKFYKTHPEVAIPKFATEQSACFDLAYQPHGKEEVTGFSRVNRPIKRRINRNGMITVTPGDRMMLPTGLIMDIPEGYSVRVHPRSGLSFKQGILLANCEGVVDSDYFHELHILVYNASEQNFDVNVGDRIAQAELVPVEKYALVETTEVPKQKTDRVGGLGSTGVKARVSKPIEKTVTEDGRTVYQVDVGKLPPEKVETVIKEKDGRNANTS
jgi:dUTP pyrophosphatase